MMLLGFVLMTIYGIGLQVLPRFGGNPIVMGIWPWLQWACLNLGVALLSAGFVFVWTIAEAAGGVLVWLSLAIYVVRVWPVLWPRAVAGGRVTIPIAPVE